MKVVLVSLGILQQHIFDNIKQLKLQGNNDIVLLTEKKFFDKIDENLNIELIDVNEYHSEYINFYKQCSQLDRNFRDGFWFHCSMRFFYIYEYMKRNNVTDIFHIENDNMIYENLDVFKDKFEQNKIYYITDGEMRVIPGVIFIQSHEVLKIVLDNYDIIQNDMANLGKHIFAPYTELLPIISITDDNNVHMYNKNYKIFNCIFDGAAMGQYLGGLDKRNDPSDTLGYINLASIIKYNNYKFYWKKINNLWNPYVEIDNKLVKIINLHIHSKFLDKFLSDNPEENKFISKII